jgi:hypothetical protein
MGKKTLEPNIGSFFAKRLVIFHFGLKWRMPTKESWKSGKSCPKEESLRLGVFVYPVKSAFVFI